MRINKDFATIIRSMFSKLLCKDYYDFETKRSKQVLKRFKNKVPVE